MATLFCNVLPSTIEGQNVEEVIKDKIYKRKEFDIEVPSDNTALRLTDSKNALAFKIYHYLKNNPNIDITKIESVKQAIDSYLDNYFFTGNYDKLILDVNDSDFYKIQEILNVIRNKPEVTLKEKDFIVESLSGSPLFKLVRFLPITENRLKVFVGEAVQLSKANITDSSKLNPMKRTAIALRTLLGEAKKAVHFNPEKHEYTIFTNIDSETGEYNYVTVDSSVTSISRDEKPDADKVITEDAALGTIFDKIARTFVTKIQANPKEYFDGEYLNIGKVKELIRSLGISKNVMTEKAIETTADSLKAMWERLNLMHPGGFIAIAGIENGDSVEDLPPLYGKVKTISGEKFTAGTVDMFIIDANGDISIYDFKTRVSTSKNKIYNNNTNLNSNTAYKNQLNFYADLLSYMSPSLKSRIKNLRILKFERSNGNKEINPERDLDGNGLLNNPSPTTINSFIGFEAKFDEVEEFAEESKKGIFKGVERKQTEPIVRDLRLNDLYRRFKGVNDINLSAFAASREEARKLLYYVGLNDYASYELAVCLAKNVIAKGIRIYDNRNVVNYPEAQGFLSGINIDSTQTQQEFLATYMDMLYDEVINDMTVKAFLFYDDEKLIKLLRDPTSPVKSFIKHLGLTTLRSMEGIVLSNSTYYYNPYANTEEVDDNVLLEMKMLEPWKYEHNLRSFRSTMSADMKRFLSMIPENVSKKKTTTKKNKDTGHVVTLIYDFSNLGLTTYSDGVRLCNALLTTISKCADIDSMMEAIANMELEGETKHNLLRALQSDNALASKFFSTFRKAQSLYGAIKRITDSEGNEIILNEVLNASNQEAAFRTATKENILYHLANMLDGDFVSVTQTLQQFQEALVNNQNTIINGRVDYKGIFSGKYKTNPKFNKLSAENLVEVLRKFGFAGFEKDDESIDGNDKAISLLRKAVSYDLNNQPSGSASTTEVIINNLFKIRTALQQLLDDTTKAFYSQNGIERFSKLREEDKKFILENVKERLLKLHKNGGNPYTTLTVIESDEFKDDKFGKLNLFDAYAGVIHVYAVASSYNIDSSVYFDGKNFYTYTNPSYIDNLVNKLNGNDLSTTPIDYINEHFYKTRFFLDNNVERNVWLKLIKEGYYKPRHKTQLGFTLNKNTTIAYRDMGDLMYQMSMIFEYFGSHETIMIDDNVHNTAWFRVPTMSNKPAAEYIQMPTFSIGQINDHIMDLFMQELWRIKNVVYRARLGNQASYIESYDLFFSKEDENEFKKTYEETYNKLKSTTAEPVFTIEDVKNFIKFGKGAKFSFLRFLNKEDSQDNETLNYIANYLNGKATNPSVSIEGNLKILYTNYMEEEFVKAVKEWYELGMFDTDINYEKNGEIFVSLKNFPSKLRDIKLVDYNNIYNTVKVPLTQIVSPEIQEQLEGLKKSGRSLFADKELYKTVVQEINNWVVNAFVLEENSKANANKINNNALLSALHSYHYNDWYGTIQMVQVTSIDYAYYSNFDAFQKRNAQQHSPSSRANKHAKDIYSSTNKYQDVSDGKHRSLIIADFEGKESEIIECIKNILEDEKAKITNPADRDAFEVVKSWILDQYKNGIVVTDGQAYSSPTSYRKKMIMFGRWSWEKEAVYKEMLSPSNPQGINLLQLKEIFQPLKPFLFSQSVIDTGLINGKTNTPEQMITTMQHKNSEYLLCLTDAIVRNAGDNNPTANKLKLIFDLMERSASKMGISKCIDTVEFASCVKLGGSGVVDLNTPNVTLADVEALIYNGNDYNKDYIHESDYDDYGIQQEVPAHFQNHEQLMGSQGRVLTPADAPEVYKKFVKDANGKKVVVDVDSASAIKEYEEAVASLIIDSAKRLLGQLGLLDQPKEYVNNKIRELLSEQIRLNEKYSTDLLELLELDSNFDFVGCLYDPSISIRIQELLSSVVKNRINKLELPGGSLVQVSNYGTTSALHIVFVDNEGNRIRDKKPDESVSDYQKYLSSVGARLSHLEAYATCPDEELEKLLTRADGTIRTLEEAVAEKLLTQEEADTVGEIIGYRIPTEDKYSMLPIKIVGFLSRKHGEAIMLPNDITLLTGSDFDIDKLYIIRRTYDIIARYEEEEKEKNPLKGKGINIYEAWHKEYTVNQALQGRILEDIFNSIKHDAFYEAIEKEDFEYLASFLAAGEDAKTAFINYLKNTLQPIIDKEKEGIENSDTNSPRLKSIRVHIKKKDSKTINRNKVFDFQWMVLTDPSTLVKMFNPGNFESPKKTARLVTFLNTLRDQGLDKFEFNGNVYDITDTNLSKLSRKDLDKLLSQYSADEHDISFSRNQRYYQKHNMAAAKLIGVFANHNVSHAILQRQNITYQPNEKRSGSLGVKSFVLGDFTLNVGDKLDAMKGKDGYTYISKVIAEFIAASVDAAKDPVLNFLNLNSATSGVAMVLARLGFNTKSIGLFLNQKIIRDVADAFAKASNDRGFANADKVVNEIILKKTGKNWYELVEKNSTPIINLDTKTLIDNTISANENVDKTLLILFKHLLQVSKDLNEMTFQTKFNSINNSVGPQIINSIKNRKRVENFDADQLREETRAHFYINPIYTKSGFASYSAENNIINSNPILKAFYRCTYGISAEDMAVERRLIERFFPQYNRELEIIADHIIGISSSTYIDEKKYNKMVNEYIFYKMTKALNLNRAEKVNIVTTFPRKFKTLAETNPLIKYIYDLFVYNVSKDTFSRLDLISDKFEAEEMAKIQSILNSLSRGSFEEKAFVRDFLYYTIIRSAYNYNGKSPIHLITTNQLLSIPGYMTAMKDILRNAVTVSDTLSEKDLVEENFIYQYLLHHTDDWSLVQNINTSLKRNDKIQVTKDNDILTIQADGQNTKLSNTDIGCKRDCPYPFKPVVTYDDEVYLLQPIISSQPNKVNRVQYKKVRSLGIPNQLYEYDSDVTSVEEITSTAPIAKAPVIDDVNYATGNYTIEDLDYLSNLYIDSSLLNIPKEVTTALKYYNALRAYFTQKELEVLGYDEIKEEINKIC